MRAGERTPRAIAALACWLAALAGVSAQSPPASGEAIYRSACLTCHGPDGRGSPRAVVGFATPLPDFTDCAFASAEADIDWFSVVHEGGPVRGLARHMPAFGDALSDADIDAAVAYLRRFCANRAWPAGDLNLPRAFFTEKAFPENETVWTTGVNTSGPKAVSNLLVFEHRIRSRSQYEVTIPLDFQQTTPGQPWARGIGDVELALRRSFYASIDHTAIFAAGGAVTLPTGKEELGLGNGFTVVEPFAMWGQMIGTSAFVQTHVGYEVASDQTRGQNEGFVRTALGYTVAQDRGFGRSWTPMLEVLAAKPEGGAAEWDLVPQMQISLSKLQHILFSVGVRVPINERDERKPQVLAYFLWDWFDGGLFQFWK